MQIEDWKTFKKIEVDIQKSLSDEIHDFLTKVFNVYLIKLPLQVFKQFEIVRDKLIPLTSRFDQDKYNEYCDSFSKVYRSVLLDKSVSDDIKKLVLELATKTNNFFISRNMTLCIKEIRYYSVKVKALFTDKSLADAIVVIESEGRVVSSTKTDPNGMAYIEVPEGKYTIYLYKNIEEGKYIYEERDIVVPQDSEIIFKVYETKTRSDIEKEREGRPLIREVSESLEESRGGESS
uniref:Uncharacterized protein n=1 Tax=Ignisphaera aggregans TaxID=334771 RepID=A0A7C5TJ58_9CREN